MKLLITGACGFVGHLLANGFRESGHEVSGIDNLSREGSEANRASLRRLGVKFFHGDLRQPSDVAALPAADWVIDAAANPSVLAGLSGATASRQVVEHNLLGTVNLLEYCKQHGAGFILLSTSRVYSLAALAELKLQTRGNAFHLAKGRQPHGVTRAGVAETFSTAAPISLYGATKLASETLALEYGSAFGFPVWINRCGVLAGAGQFGKADQGIFTFWINSWLRHRPLKYIGFGGHGHQVRDALHPRDLLPLLAQQMKKPSAPHPRIVNVSGGLKQSMSLAQLSDWCTARFGKRTIASEPATRPFDVPWLVLDSGVAERAWNWRPQTGLEEILDEIAAHAEEHPEWLELSGVA
ncbi:MAG: NAD-dependent epimerase/dehydratase family protein [Verrucomicrobiota bacterium]